MRGITILYKDKNSCALRDEHARGGKLRGVTKTGPDRMKIAWRVKSVPAEIQRCAALGKQDHRCQELRSVSKARRAPIAGEKTTPAQRFRSMGADSKNCFAPSKKTNADVENCAAFQKRG